MLGRVDMRSTLHRLALSVPLLVMGCNDPTPKLHIERTVVASGEDIVVVFDTPLEGRATNQYWIALQRADEPLTSTTGRVVLERTDRSVRLRVNQPGDLEVRLHGGYPRLEHHLVARIPIAAGTWPIKVGAQLSNGNECLDRWLVEHELDPYGMPRGTAYPGGSPLYDEATGRWTARWEHVTAKHPPAMTACEPQRGSP